MNRGLFITFEGGEGAGKSTLIQRLRDELTVNGYEVLTTREPGGTPLGEEVRKLLLHKEKGIEISDIAEMLLFLSARAEHIHQVIKPALEEGKIVLCDRFNDSTVAYQGGGRGLGTQWVREVCNSVCGSIPPDVTFFLDVDTFTGLQRALQTGSADRIESEKGSFHQRVHDTFLQIAREEPNRVFCIDSTRSKEEVFQAAIKIINEQFKDRSG